MSNILEKIISDKRHGIEKYKKSYKVEDLKNKISSYKNYLNFKDKLKKNQISVIAEIKKASPSAGIIMENYDPKVIAKQYLNSGASCLSILTEENYFKGKLEHINEVKKEVKLPVLCKDFFIDPYQVYLAKSFGADAILIILAAVDSKTAEEIYRVSEELNISTIVEVHTEEEARNRLQERGHSNILKYTLPANQAKESHSHPHDADVIVITGNIKIVTTTQEYNLGPGDEFQLDGGTMHAEEVGDKGVVLLAAKPTDTPDQK